MKPRILIATLLLAPFTAPAAGAQGWILPRPCVRPMPVEDGRPMPCPPTDPTIVRTRSDVKTRLEGRVLRYEVEERFVNRGAGLGEADYIFPLPKGAAFQDLKLSINGELVAGETMNANEARRIYEEIVRKQRDPALVEYMGHGLLRARIFPINPGEEKRVVVRFDAVAEREGDAMRVDYFRGTPPNENAIARDGRRRPDEARSSFVLTYSVSPSLGTPYSPTHTLAFDDEGPRRRVEVRGDARDVTILFPLRRGNQPAISMLAHAPGREDGFALITLAPPAGRARATTPRDLTFVLDVSGSMNGRKMEQGRAAGKQLLRTLRPHDRFRLVDFATDVRTFRDEFVLATPANLRAAERYLDALDAQGSTNISGALEEALRDLPDDDDDDRLGLVLFVTDGEPTVGERRPDAIAETASRARRGRRVFTFGVGSDVNVALLERLALEGHGTAQFVRPDESVERMVEVVASRLVDPVLTDVRVRAEGNVRLEKVLPQQPIDLFAGQDLVLLARYDGDGDARLVFEGRRGGERVQWTSAVNFPDRDRENAFVARLWATQRVGYLAAEKRRNGGSRELDAEIRELGERYGIPTEFTSYLVLEPGMQPANQLSASVGSRRDGRDLSGRGAAAAPAPVAAQAEGRFEKAREAAQQRSARTLADVDAIGITGASNGTKRVDGRTFTLQGETWTDVRYRDSIRTVAVKPFSREYFELMNRVPELKAVFALGERVVVVGRGIAVRLDPNAGTADVDAIVGQF